MDLFEIGGLSPQYVFQFFIFHPLHSLHWARLLLPCTFVNLFKLWYHFATITNPWIWTICGTLKGFPFGLSSFLLGLLGVFGKFYRKHLRCLCEHVIGRPWEQPQWTRCMAPKEGGMFLFCSMLHWHYKWEFIVTTERTAFVVIRVWWTQVPAKIH